MTETRPADFTRFANWPVDLDRMVADGVALPDLQRAAVEVKEWEAWYAFWAARGEEYAAVAEHNMARGRRILAGGEFWQACMAYHYAQFFWFHNPPVREAGQRRKVELWRRAAPLLDPHAERLQLRVDDISFDAYVRLPSKKKAAERAPCVILLGGLESTKEESYLFENECLRRGIATCTFDGPGQGETFFSARVRGDFERFTSMVLDRLERHPDLDAGRVGILGRSLGGNYAVRSAALDQRLVACAAWGALVDMSYWDTLEPGVRGGFAYAAGFGLDQVDAAGEYLNQVLDLRPVLDRVRCPVYIQHGECDQIIPVSQVQILVDGLVNTQPEVDIVQGGNHCAHNRYHVARPRLADWIIGQLGGSV